VAPPRHTAVAEPQPEDRSFAQPDESFHPLLASNHPELAGIKLPAGFQWGLASSAYQIEGAAKADGKGPSIWDLLAHVPGFVADNSTGDVVAEHYYLFRRDIARLKALGVRGFSPSISWPRLFPFGAGPVNAAGVAHYDAVMSEIVGAGITPAVTLFHWDTPLALFSAYGGWTDARVVDDFVRYAKFVISRYDAVVPTWFTVNEPQYCNWQYATYPAGRAFPAPNNVTAGLHARFLCGHHTLLAHARVAYWYRHEFKGRGRISFKNSGNFHQPADDGNAGDVRAARRQWDFSLGWFAGPWTADGDYPETLRATLRPAGLLPRFTREELGLIRGSCDFFAVDAYSAFEAYGRPAGEDEACIANASHPAFPECAAVRQRRGGDKGFPLGPAADASMGWLRSTPGGIRRFLKAIVQTYPAVPDVVVAEFGFAEPGEAARSTEDALWDLRRAVSLLPSLCVETYCGQDYFQGFLDNILAAIHLDGVNITGIWGWAVYDNFEWNAGVGTRFGLQHLNYTDLTRTPKASMFQFLKWFR
jgi:beta-glucosidase